MLVNVSRPEPVRKKLKLKQLFNEFNRTTTIAGWGKGNKRLTNG